MPSFCIRPSGFGISTRLTGCGLYVPLSNCSWMPGQCYFRNSGNCQTVMPSTPALPLLALTRFNACLQFSRSQTSSVNCSETAGLAVPRFAVSDSEGASGLHPYPSPRRPSSLVLLPLSPMSRVAYSPLPSPSLWRTVWAFMRRRTAAPACRLLPLGQDGSFHPQSRFRTNGRSQEVISTAFRTQRRIYNQCP
jgi:hypothetical protein